MVNFPKGKIYNAYLIETENYQNTKMDILEFIASNDFDRNVLMSYNHPDVFFLEIEDEKIKAQDIKKIISEAFFSPKVEEKKFYIIYDANFLDENMQNTLLKTLEEPPKFDVFILVTTNKNKLLDTIKSRCFYIKDDNAEDYKKILDFEYIDEAILILSNIKYENDAKIMKFAENFDKREDLFRKLISLYRHILRDSIIYKKTLSKELINVKEKENEIKEIANTFTYEELGYLIEGLDKMSKEKNLQIDKTMSVFNYLRNVYKNE